MKDRQSVKADLFKISHTDAMVGAWLPSTHAEYYDTYKADPVDLGKNLHGTKNGLVVPDYVDIDSIEDLK